MARMVRCGLIQTSCEWSPEKHSLEEIKKQMWHHIGRDQHSRERYRGHAHFAAAERFCADWDQNSFDPDYDTMPLEFFEPILTRVLLKQAQ